MVAMYKIGMDKKILPFMQIDRSPSISPYWKCLLVA